MRGSWKASLVDRLIEENKLLGTSAKDWAVGVKLVAASVGTESGFAEGSFVKFFFFHPFCCAHGVAEVEGLVC